MSESKFSIDLTNRPLMFEPYRLSALVASGRPEGLLSLFFDESEEERPYRMDGNIAVFDIRGGLYNEDFRFITNNGYKSFQKVFKKSLEDSTVEGILLNLDSPGGEASGLFDLSDEMYASRGIKPIWAIANDDMFSAAYGIGSAADRIYLTRTGGVGSVGVVAVHLEISKAADKAGMTFTVFRGGSYKAESNRIERLTPHAKESMQEEVDRLYGMFVELVARNRGLSEEKVRDTEASLYFAEKGIEVGFADRLGTYERAMEDLKQFTSRKKGNAAMSEQNTNQTGARTTGATSSADETPKNDVRETQSESTTQATTGNQQRKPIASLVSFDDALTEANRNAQANVRRIAELCQIAGRPELACGFIEQGLSAEEAGKKLIDMRAVAADANPLDGHHEPPAGSARPVHIDAKAIYASRRRQMLGKE